MRMRRWRTVPDFGTGKQARKRSYEPTAEELDQEVLGRQPKMPPEKREYPETEEDREEEARQRLHEDLADLIAPES